MSAERDPVLQRVFETAERAFLACDRPPEPSRALAERVFRRLEQPAAPDARADAAASAEAPTTLPACVHLDAALSRARAKGAPLAGLADAVAGILPTLTWVRRAGVGPEAGDFYDGHANCYLAGPRGCEIRSDVVVGMSLIAPQVRYPDHDHPPEEFYVVLSGGEWRQEDGPWHAPGEGGVVHNPPGIRHAMRAGEAPLLALWFLWNG